MEDNILGRGIDNHLLGLREAAREAGDGALPPLFTDPTYKQMMEFKLSTSQVYSFLPLYLTFFYSPLLDVLSASLALIVSTSAWQHSTGQCVRSCVATGP